MVHSDHQFNKQPPLRPSKTRCERIFNPSTPLATSQVVLLYRSALKLFEIIKKARHKDAIPRTLRVLQDISRRCNPCQCIQSDSTRFRFRMGVEECKFNERIFLDIMCIKSKPILHIVDEGTCFNAFRFLSRIYTSYILKTIIQCWNLVYIGLPNRILTDQGSQFGDKCIHIAGESEMEVS